MKGKSLIFKNPGKVEIKTEDIPQPDKAELLVKTKYSAISAGTELLVYRGQFPEDLRVDSTISTLNQKFAYPLKYGYSAVGKVIAVGPDINRDWLGKRVFSFKSHSSHFLAKPEELYPLPEEITQREALFFPSVETAINIIQDAAPLLGEKALVIGQGVIGLMTSNLLARFPLTTLMAVDKYPLRRKESLRAGCQDCLDPESVDFSERLEEFFKVDSKKGGADLVIELSGDPEALNPALNWTGFSGRIIIGSWYGKKKTTLNLGGEFHRRRITLKSSQVSTIDPRLADRWDKTRRWDLTWSALKKIKPENLISHEFTLEEAKEVFNFLDKHPESVLQILFRYGD